MQRADRNSNLIVSTSRTNSVVLEEKESDPNAGIGAGIINHRARIGVAPKQGLDPLDTISLRCVQREIHKMMFRSRAQEVEITTREVCADQRFN